MAMLSSRDASIHEWAWWWPPQVPTAAPAHLWVGKAAVQSARALEWLRWPPDARRRAFLEVVLFTACAGLARCTGLRAIARGDEERARDG